MWPNHRLGTVRISSTIPEQESILQLAEIPIWLNSFQAELFHANLSNYFQ